MKPRIALLVAVGAFALAVPAVFAAEHSPPYVGTWPGWHGPWVGFWWICPLIMLFMVAFFAMLFFVFRRHRGDWGPPSRWMSGRHAYEGYRGAESESALDILNKRYARGEIGKEEYGEIKTMIASGDDRSPGQT